MFDDGSDAFEPQPGAVLGKCRFIIITFRFSLCYFVEFMCFF